MGNFSLALSKGAEFAEVSNANAAVTSYRRFEARTDGWYDIDDAAVVKRLAYVTEVVIGPATNVDRSIPFWNGTDNKTLGDASGWYIDSSSQLGTQASNNFKLDIDNHVRIRGTNKYLYFGGTGASDWAGYIGLGSSDSLWFNGFDQYSFGTAVSGSQVKNEFVFASSSNTATNCTSLNFYRYRDTGSLTLSGDYLSTFTFYGEPTEATPGLGGEIRITAGNNWSGTSFPTIMDFRTCATSQVSPSTRLKINESGYIIFGSSSQGVNAVTTTISSGSLNTELPTALAVYNALGAATTITVATESTDTTCFPVFVTDSSGSLGPKVNTSLTFNSSTAELGASILKSTVAIGTAPLVITSTTRVSNLNVASSGQSDTVNTSADSTNGSLAILFVNSASGYQTPHTSTGLYYNPFTGTITTGIWGGTAIGSTKGGTGLSSFAQYSMLYASSANTWAELTKGTANYVLTSAPSTQIPTWALIGNDNIATGAGIALTKLANGTRGAIIYYGASGWTTLTMGTTGQYLAATASGDPLWSTPSSSVPTLITVANEATDTTCFPLFVTAATGDLGPKTNANLTFNSSTGVLGATTFSGSGSSLTSLPAGQLSGTIPSAVLGNSTLYVGTTAIALNRASAAQAITGITTLSMNNQLTNTLADGTAPFVITSTTKVSNLNVDLHDGYHIATLTTTRLLRYNSSGTQIENATVTESSGALGSITTINMSGQLTNTLAIGTAPFVITSTTQVANLYVARAGYADLVTTAQSSVNASYPILFVSSLSGNQEPHTSNSLYFNPFTGTITTGIWGGTAITVAKGGTGLTTVALGSVLAANALDTISAITSVSGTKWLRNNAGTISWETISSGGDVYGDTTSTDNQVVRYNGTDGKHIQNSNWYVHDDGQLINNSSAPATDRKFEVSSILYVDSSVNNSGLWFYDPQGDIHIKIRSTGSATYNDFGITNSDTYGTISATCNSGFFFANGGTDNYCLESLTTWNNTTAAKGSEIYLKRGRDINNEGVNSGDFIGYIRFYGYTDTSAWVEAAKIAVKATEQFVDANDGATEMRFYVHNGGGLVNAFSIQSDAKIMLGSGADVNNIRDLAAGIRTSGSADDDSLATEAAIRAAIDAGAGGGIAQTIFNNKGDLITCAVADTPAILGVGSNYKVLMADSSQTYGLKYDYVTDNNIGTATINTTKLIGTNGGRVLVSKVSPDKGVMESQFLYTLESEAVGTLYLGIGISPSYKLHISETSTDGTQNCNYTTFIFNPNSSAGFNPSAIYGDITHAGANNITSGIMSAGRFRTILATASKTVATMNSITGFSYLNNGTATSMSGGYFFAGQSASGGTCSSTNVYGVKTEIDSVTSATLTTTNSYLFYGAYGTTGTLSITTKYGIYLSDVTGGSTNYAIYTGSGGVRLGGALTLAASPGDGSGDTYVLTRGAGGIINQVDKSTLGGGAGDNIYEGDSKVEVVDLGTGYVNITIDATTILQFKNSVSNFGVIPSIYLANGSDLVAYADSGRTLSFILGAYGCSNTYDNAYLKFYRQDSVSISTGDVLGEIGFYGFVTSAYYLGSRIYSKAIATMTTTPSDSQIAIDFEIGGTSQLYLTGGYAQFPKYGYMFTSTLGSDHTWDGEVAEVTVDVNAYGFGAALFIASDGNYEQADADAGTSMPCVALALETGTGTKKILRRGIVRDDSWSWTVGAESGTIFVSTDPSTLGGLTQTKPTGTTDRVQVVGYALSATKIYFNPEMITRELT